GHAPALEEDLALANIGLDLLGQARHLLSHAAQLQGNGCSEDDLAFLREPQVAELAAKAIKETRYHFRFSSGWVVRLGDGTEESHQRVQTALDALWRFTHEMFVASPAEQEAVAAGIAPD